MFSPRKGGGRKFRMKDGRMILRMLERATRNCFNLKLCIIQTSLCVVCIHIYKYSINEVKPLGLSIFPTSI